MDHHKRSKSGIARSLIHRVSSKQDIREDDSPVNPTSNSSTSSMSSLVPRHKHSLSHHHHSGHHHLHVPTATSSAGSDTAASPTDALPQASSRPSLSGHGSSIEQSVRLFRIFEALRSGDTAAISKAIRESQSSASDTDLDDDSLHSRNSTRLEGTSVLHLAIQCADIHVIEFLLSSEADAPDPKLDLNGKDRDGNTPLHLAAMLGRTTVVRLLLDQDGIIDSAHNFQGQTPLDLARTPEIFQQLQLARSVYIENNLKKIHEYVAARDYENLEKLLVDARIQSTIDFNGVDLATESHTVETGGTLLHEAARKKDVKLIQLLLLNGADPFRRDRKGKLPQDVTKDDRTRAILKRSPAAAAAQRGIQERTVLGAATPQAAAASDGAPGGKEGREMKGYLKKWTNYTGGYKLRWFVLEDGVLSYYKHQDDAGSACRGAINMKIAKLYMDPQDKQRFEIQGKSSVKYHLKANHQVEAKRWFWALNNAIQWSRDEAKEEEKKHNRESEALRQARADQLDKGHAGDHDGVSVTSSRVGGKGLVPATALGAHSNSGSKTAVGSAVDEDEGAYSGYEASVGGGDISKIASNMGATTIDGDLDDEEDYGDDASSREAHPVSKDAFSITAQSAKIQLDLIEQVSAALQAESARKPEMQLSDPIASKALSSYEAAIGNLKGLVGDLLRISRDREAFWQYRLEREASIRRMWEDSMARVAKEQEELENKIGESEIKRKRTKRALKDALDGQLSTTDSRARSLADEKGTADLREAFERAGVEADASREFGRRSSIISPARRKTIIADIADISDSDSDDDEEFFDAISAGEVGVLPQMPVSSPGLKQTEIVPAVDKERDRKQAEIVGSFKGYEDPPRSRLKLAADNRPKISLWGILKSMIGKDMTKMTLPVSFNEPTSLLQRVAEDMEYTELLDTAAERLDSTERMLYVAAFAASEYASTIGRVAKPFNPLLGETYEYARPDKGYRFFIEQVSHHPPIGAAYAESPKWDYYGESAVKSKFYGKSFDINPLGTWFLRLRPSSGGTELYTWKKVTSSVIGIITGNPTVDNYGPMEIKNWTTGETCLLDFKPRGWKASSAYQVTGKVTDAQGNTRWSIGGRWNDKIYARLTPGFEGLVTPPRRQDTGLSASSTQAFLVWEANSRPTGIPFNLTPFVVTLNALPDRLRPVLAPTDTRLRPDQRAMEDGEYDFAATEKNRVEEKQRARRRQREENGEEFVPRWFTKGKCEITGEEYWVFNGEYWKLRDKVAAGEGSWKGLEDIF